MSTRKGSKGFLFGALAGGVLGSIAALLFAPKAGKELRHDISVQAQKAGDKTGEIVKGIGNGAIQLADRTKHAASSVAGNVRSFGRGRGEMATISGVAAEAAEELATGVVERTTDAAEHLEDATEELYHNAAEAVESAADVAEEAAEHGVEWTEEAFEETSDAVRETFEEIGEHATAGTDAESNKER